MTRGLYVFQKYTSKKNCDIYLPKNVGGLIKGILLVDRLLDIFGDVNKAKIKQWPWMQ